MVRNKYKSKFSTRFWIWNQARRKLFVQCEILILWEAKEEYLQAKYQRASQIIYEPKWDFTVFLWILVLWTSQNKTFKSHLKGTEGAVYYGHK